jgi:hypothetical protein
MNAKEKEQQLKEWNERNKHVMEVNSSASNHVIFLLDNGWDKADIILFSRIIEDIAKRFD